MGQKVNGEEAGIWMNGAKGEWEWRRSRGLDEWGVKQEGAPADSTVLPQHHNADVICKKPGFHLPPTNG